MKRSYTHYLQPSQNRSSWGIDLLASGFAIIDPGQRYPPAGHPADYVLNWKRGRILKEFQIIFISQGSGELESAAAGESNFHVEAPALFLVYPGVWHRYRPKASSGWHEHWVAFDGTLPRKLWKSGELSENRPVVEIEPSAQLLAQFELLHEEAQREALGFRPIAASAILQILALAASLPKRHIEETHPMRILVRQACVILHERSNQAVTPADIASELHISYSYFRRLFKRYTYTSPNRYHAELRLQRSKRLLQHTDSTVSEVANAVGFPSPFHFSSWFKKETGLAPKIWRTSALKRPRKTSDIA